MAAKRFIRMSLLALLVLAEVGAIVQFDVAAAQSGPPRVGLITSLTGSLAPFGREIVNAAEFFNNVSRNGIEIDTCDDEGDPGKAINCLSRIINRNSGNVSAVVVGSLHSGAAQAIREKAGSLPTPVISVGKEAPATGQRPPNYFRVGTSTGFLVSRAAQYIKEVLKPSAVTVLEERGILTPGHAWTTIFPRMKMTAEPLAPDAIQNGIDAVATSKPNLVLAPGWAERKLLSSGAIPKDSRLVIYSTAGIGAFEDVNSPDVFIVTVPGDQTPEGEQFRSRYEQKYSVPPNLGYGYQTYAVFEILSSVLGTGTPEKGISSELKRRTFSTILGSIAFGANGNSTWPSEAVWKSDDRRNAAATGGTRCDCSLADCCDCQCCKSSNCNGDCAPGDC
jgi:ABC-type branched-subunit amino acid transport system substrate-binding protein